MARFDNHNCYEQGDILWTDTHPEREGGREGGRGREMEGERETSYPGFGYSTVCTCTETDKQHALRELLCL